MHLYNPVTPPFFSRISASPVCTVSECTRLPVCRINSYHKEARAYAAVYRSTIRVRRKSALALREDRFPKQQIEHLVKQAIEEAFRALPMPRDEREVEHVAQE